MAIEAYKRCVDAEKNLNFSLTTHILQRPFKAVGPPWHCVPAQIWLGIQGPWKVT